MSVARLPMPLLLAALAGPVLAQQPTRPLAAACPNLTAGEVAAIESYRGNFPEHAIYARTYCVSIEEAARRIAISTNDSMGALTATLQEKEAATFAGLWVEHQPEYRVMVAFTRDAAATLAKYTRDPLFKPVDRPRATLAQLHATQERLVKEFTKRRISAMLSSLKDKGTVEVRLSQESGPIRAAAARGEFPLPDYVVLIEPDPFPFPAPPPPEAGDKRVKSFPQVPYRTDMLPSTLMGVPDVPAKLKLVDGCLKLETEKETLTALWQAPDALDLSDPTRVTVLNRLTGTRVAAGEEIVLMGLQPGEDRVPEQVVGAKGCPGPYRVVRGYLSRSTWEERQREQEERN